MNFISCTQNIKWQKLNILKIKNMKLRLIKAKQSFNQTISNLQTGQGKMET
jgi:hypothetical protein